MLSPQMSLSCGFSHRPFHFPEKSSVVSYIQHVSLAQDSLKQGQKKEMSLSLCPVFPVPDFFVLFFSPENKPSVCCQEEQDERKQ